ncbi:MAG: hypothetical protein EBS53_13950, partial [Bacteroidetes bacterium]|nr:hypothetical protein [Bacteroidota bacterium]
MPNIFGFYHHPFVKSRVFSFIIALWVFMCLLTSCVESSRTRNRSIELFVFLAPDCPASLYYIPE